MGKYNFGDIYLVKFHPSYGNELKRYRPALIVSSVVNDIDSRFTMVAPISTKFDLDNKFEVIMDSYALDQKSSVLLWYIRTIDVARLEVKIGEISVKNKKECQLVINKILK